MKTWKLVSGILSIILSIFVFFQSMLAGLANSIEANGEVGGTGGVLVAILLLAGGITSIAVRNSEKNSGNVAIIVLFCFATFFGYTMAGSTYTDLYVWASWCLINAILGVISYIKIKKG